MRFLTATKEDGKKIAIDWDRVISYEEHEEDDVIGTLIITKDHEIVIKETFEEVEKTVSSIYI